MSKQYGTPIDVDIEVFREDPRTWLAQQMSANMPWLLAHADDGVIWGKWQENGSLLLSSDVFGDPAMYPSIAVPLRAVTLQQARVFGPAGDLLVWRTGGGFTARLLVDDQLELDALPKEEHLLWHLGNRVKTDQEAGFAVLQEGQQGQRHAPPVIPQGRQRPRLIVRHYVDYDEKGQAFIALSRLVNLEV